MGALGRWESRGGRLVNSARSLEFAIDKFLSLAHFQQAGLLVPDTVTCQTVEDTMAAFETLGGDVVLKPLFGGEGRPEDAMLLLSWVQALRVAVQLALIVLTVLPGGAVLGTLLAFAASILGIWISVMFITQCFNLSSGWKGLGVLALAGMAVVLSLSVIWAIVGPMPEAIADV